MTRTFLVAAVLAGCSGTTGSALLTFTARAAGPADAQVGLEFDSGSGYHVTLASAAIHIGAIYLNRSVPLSGGSAEPCILPGIYVGEAFGGCDARGRCGVDVDLLSPEWVTFPLPGEGTGDRAVEAEVWLSGGDVNAVEDPTPILTVAGSASRDGQQWPFAATVTIGSNRQMVASNPQMPGASPICRQRIVSPIPIAPFTLASGGTVELRVDPRVLIDGVEFASLTAADLSDGVYVIPDRLSTVGSELFGGLLAANTGVYSFTFTPK